MSSFKTEEAPFSNTFQPQRKYQAHPADVIVLCLLPAKAWLSTAMICLSSRSPNFFGRMEIGVRGSNTKSSGPSL